MSSLTQRHSHSHRAEHPYGQGGSSNYLKGRGDRGMVSQSNITESKRGSGYEQAEEIDGGTEGQYAPCGFSSASAKVYYCTKPILLVCFFNFVSLLV